MEKQNCTQDELLQNYFTAFIKTSIYRAKIDYLNKKKAEATHTYNLDYEELEQIEDDSDFVSELSDSWALLHALSQISERERFVVLARVVNKSDFEEIAQALDLKYKGVASVYYRALSKLKNILGGK